jgi:hypothetical protein
MYIPSTIYIWIMYVLSKIENVGNPLKRILSDRKLKTEHAKGLFQKINV